MIKSISVQIKIAMSMDILRILIKILAEGKIKSIFDSTQTDRQTRK